MFCQVTWPMATGAAMVGSRPVGSTPMPMTIFVFAASAGRAQAITIARLAMTRLNRASVVIGSVLGRRNWGNLHLRETLFKPQNPRVALRGQGGRGNA